MDFHIFFPFSPPTSGKEAPFKALCYLHGAFSSFAFIFVTEWNKDNLEGRQNFKDFRMWLQFSGNDR